MAFSAAEAEDAENFCSWCSSVPPLIIFWHAAAAGEGLLLLRRLTLVLNTVLDTAAAGAGEEVTAFTVRVAEAGFGCMSRLVVGWAARGR